MAIKTRETTGTGVTNNAAPLTNAELDNNWIEVVSNTIYKATNTNNVAGVWKATIADVTSYYDGLMIAFYPNKIDGVSGGTTFEINSLGAKTVTRPDSSTNAITTHYDGTNLIFLRYVSADDYFIVHANHNSTDDYRIRYQNHVIANNSAGSGTAWHGYQLLMEGADGTFYPVTEGGQNGNNNTVSTAELRVGGHMLVYERSTDIAAGAAGGAYYLYSTVRVTTMERWNNRDSAWATANKPWYIVATLNGNNNFVLDNTSSTSFLTQALPGSDDGKYYIHGGLMHDTYDDYRLQNNHPIYVYKNGAIREWSGYANTDRVVEITGSSATGSGQLQLNCEVNTHGVKIKGPPHSAGANYTLTLPNDTGSNGQALTTDGSGNLSFTTISGGGGSSLTIKDEGSALSTAATTLNFTGAGVTATGSGAEKTITISGGGGSGSSGVGEGKALVFANLFG